MTTPPMPPSSDPRMPDSAPVEKASIWEDFLDIYVKPADVFRRRVDGRFGIPLLVLTALFILIVLATKQWMDPLIEAEMVRGMAGNTELTDEQRSQMISMGSKFAIVSVAFFIPIAVILTGTFVWITSKFLDVPLSWKQGATIATYANFPRVIEGIVNGAQAAMMDPSSLVGRSVLSIGPARFFDVTDSNQIMLAVLGRFDVFTLWCTILLGVGIYVIGRTTRAKAAIIAGIMWVLGTLFYVWSARPRG